MNYQIIVMDIVILVLMTPLLLFYALPFLAAARVFYEFTSLWLSSKQRLALACLIAAAGIAPAFDEYHSPIPIYLWWLDGQDVSVGYVAASVVLTWVVVWLKTSLMVKKHAQTA